VKHISILRVKSSRNLRSLLRDRSTSTLKIITWPVWASVRALVNISRVKAYWRMPKINSIQNILHVLLAVMIILIASIGVVADPLLFLPLNHFIHLFLLPKRDLLDHWLEIPLWNFRNRTWPEVKSLLLEFLASPHEPLQRRTAALLIGFLQFKRF
jgi:hypothetical protein